MPRRRVPLRSALLAVGTLAAALFLLAIVQMRPPAWWAPVAPSDAMAERAERFEQAIVSEMHRVRDSEAPWAVRVRESDINAWLAARLPLWCEHAGIERIGPAQVRLTPATIDIGLETHDLPAIAVARFRPSIEATALRPSLEAASLGRLSLPILGDHAIRSAAIALGDAEGDLRATLVRALRDESVSSTFELGDGRRVRLRDLEVRDGELLLEFETLRAEPSPR